MADAMTNIAKYKSGFQPDRKTYVKSTPFKFVQGYSNEQLAALGMKMNSSYRTPIDTNKRR